MPNLSNVRPDSEVSDDIDLDDSLDKDDIKTPEKPEKLEMPPPTPQAPPPNSVPQSNAQNFAPRQQFGGQNRPEGDGMRKKRKRRKNNSPNFQQGQPVSIVNPEQKGISLSSLQGGSPLSRPPQGRPASPELSVNKPKSVSSPEPVKFDASALGLIKEEPRPANPPSPSASPPSPQPPLPKPPEQNSPPKILKPGKIEKVDGD